MKSKEDRATRFEELAINADARSNAAYDRSSKLSERFAMGQPILVGHHSEKSARADQKRMHNAMDKSLEESRKAEHYRDKAQAALNNTNVYQGEENAVILIRERLEKREAYRERLKAFTKLVKKIGLKEALKTLDVVTLKDYIYKLDGRTAFPHYVLTNLGARIRTDKKQLEKMLLVTEKLATFEDFKVNDIEVVLSDGQLQVHFPFKPDGTTRKILKSYPLSLKWSRYSTAWVRKFTTSINKTYITNLNEMLKMVSYENI